VRLVRTGDGLELTVSDDGHGFTLEDEASGLGIPGMRERALLVGGELEIESKPPVGTRVRLRV
jgi:signal transduction histidine kinase